MQNVVEVSHVAKIFGDVHAVEDVSFDLKEGEIFGLLGPNGSGKTTTLRMILDIFKPDRGKVAVFGGELTDEMKDRIGYMPEERGLYQDVQLERCLVYLGTLKGLHASEVRKRLEGYLERFDLAEHKNKKIKELSKGMQQKAQIINTILHDPELIIIDEPFTALDPINTQMVKDLMSELRDKGAAIIMSTHQMHQVEVLCDRILLIDHGLDMLYGNLNEIQKRFSGRDLIVKAAGEMPDINGVEHIEPHNGAMKLTLSENITSQDVLDALVAQRVPLEKFEIAVPSLAEIFIRVVEEGARNE
jgi:ABC-2 type transport system ATP-binding protein